MELVTDIFFCIMCGILFIAASVVMLVYPPKKINGLYGYRTANSQKSQQRWDFSQRFSAWRMFEAGIFLIVISIGLMYADLPETTIIIIGIVLLLTSCAYMIARTEIALKKKFPY